MYLHPADLIEPFWGLVAKSIDLPRRVGSDVSHCGVLDELPLRVFYWLSRRYRQRRSVIQLLRYDSWATAQCQPGLASGVSNQAILLFRFLLFATEPFGGSLCATPRLSFTRALSIPNFALMEIIIRRFGIYSSPAEVMKGNELLRPNVATRISTIRDALDRAILIDRRILGYLSGVRRLKMIADKDVWNGEYDADRDSIILQRKVLSLSLKERVRIILHEGGHRAQFNVDTETFEHFIGKQLDRKEFFLAMANEVHCRQYELTGHVDDMAGEIFAESYARFALEMTMPRELSAFWQRRAGQLIK